MKALQIENLTKKYKNGPEALKGISLEVDEGDFFALLGPNGAGKSTTIGIITSLVNKSGGKVKVFGIDSDEDWPKTKSMIGLVPQEFNFNMFERVIDIVTNQAGYYGIPRKEALERAEHYLKKLNLWEKAFAPARMLSGGMKRRLMIARGIVHDPKLLILDEPTAGVDIEIRRSMWAFMEEINKQGTTIILTTHYLEEAENLCRNIAIIDHGQIVEHGSVKNILAKLNMETIILDLKKETSSIPDLEGYILHLKDPTTLEVSFSKDTNLNRLFASLTNNDCEVVSLRNKSNRLEELFLNLVATK